LSKDRYKAGGRGVKCDGFRSVESTEEIAVLKTAEGKRHSSNGSSGAEKASQQAPGGVSGPGFFWGGGGVNSKGVY